MVFEPCALPPTLVELTKREAATSRFSAGSGLTQRKRFQKRPVDQAENPVDRAGGPALPDHAPHGFALGIALRYRYKCDFHKEAHVTTRVFLAKT